MNKFNFLRPRQNKAVAYVFRKYGIKLPPTPQSIALVKTTHDNAAFWQDFQNAMAKQILGHSNFEDKFDYYYVDVNDDSFDGGEDLGVVDVFCFEDEDDHIGGKGKERKAKHQQKRLKRKAKRADKRSARKGGSDVEDAQEVNEESNSGEMDEATYSRPNAAEKANTALGFIKDFAGIGSDIAGALSGKNKGGESPDSGGDYARESDDSPQAKSGMSDTTIYIIVGVVVSAIVLGLVLYLRKKNK